MVGQQQERRRYKGGAGWHGKEIQGWGRGRRYMGRRYKGGAGGGEEGDSYNALVLPCCCFLVIISTRLLRVLIVKDDILLISSRDLAICSRGHDLRLHERTHSLYILHKKEFH